MKAKKYTSILGLAFEGKDLEVCHLHGAGARPRVTRSIKLPLQLDPLSGEAELVGREIRNQLDAAGLHEARCAVALPLKWLLTAPVELPDLSGSDLDDYIALQAERAFPYPPEDLALASSHLRLATGTGLATLIAIPRNAAAHLQAVLKAARLRPVSFTLGLATLPPPPAAVVLLAHGHELDLAVYLAGGFAVLRPLNEAWVSGPEGEHWNFDLIAKQIRITLGGLPAAARETIGALQILGAREQAGALAGGLARSASQLGLTIQDGRAELPDSGGDATRWSTAASVAAAVLSGKPLTFEFLPPQVSRFRQFASRISARGLVYLGVGAGALVLIAGTAFIMQGMRLQRLEQDWKTMKPRVDRVKALQDSVRAFRPWFDSSAPSLMLAARIAQAFPEEGSVWVKTIEVKDLSTITCTGSARSDRDWLALLDALRKTPGIADLQVVQARGNQPLQFSLSFHWKGGTGDAL